MIASITALSISVWIHITAALVGFGATFAEAVTFPVAMKLDKKNTGSSVTCILTRGPGMMEKVPLDANAQVFELLTQYYERISAFAG